MSKHVGSPVQREPRFDRLEIRSLLNAAPVAGYPVPADITAFVENYGPRESAMVPVVFPQESAIRNAEFVLRTLEVDNGSSGPPIDPSVIPILQAAFEALHNPNGINAPGETSLIPFDENSYGGPAQAAGVVGPSRGQQNSVSQFDSGAARFSPAMKVADFATSADEMARANSVVVWQGATGPFSRDSTLASGFVRDESGQFAPKPDGPSDHPMDSQGNPIGENSFGPSNPMFGPNSLSFPEYLAGLIHGPQMISANPTPNFARFSRDLVSLPNGMTERSTDQHGTTTADNTEITSKEALNSYTTAMSLPISLVQGMTDQVNGGIGQAYSLSVRGFKTIIEVSVASAIQYVSSQHSTPSVRPNVVSDVETGELATPATRGSELFSWNPIKESGSIEKALDLFLERLSGLEIVAADPEAEEAKMPWPAVWAVALVSLEVSRRWLGIGDRAVWFRNKAKGSRSPRVSGSLGKLAGWPGSWSSRFP